MIAAACDGTSPVFVSRLVWCKSFPASTSRNTAACSGSVSQCLIKVNSARIMEKVSQDFCKLLPKLELHAHLNGSLSNETMDYLHEKQRSSGDVLPWSRYQAVIDHGDERTLDECFELFNVAHSLTTTVSAVRKATQDVIKEFSEDGVVYLELRSTPRDVPGGMTKLQYIQAIVEGIMECIGLDINVKLLISINRRDGKETAIEMLQLALDGFKRYPGTIVGVDLSGNPNEGNIDDFLPLLSQARKLGLKIAIHVAEIPNPQEIKSILEFKPNRLGHGTCIHPLCGGSEEIWKMLLESHIPVELCLTSNVKSKTVNSYKNHHFKYLFESNHPITLATDDKGVFATSLSQEYFHAASNFSLSREQLWTLSAASIPFAFASEEECQMLQDLFLEQKNALIS